MEMNATQLNAYLIAAAVAYYSGASTMADGQPLLTDAEYDALEVKLAAMIAAQPGQASAATVLQTVGTDAPGRVPHFRPMLSIENKYSEEELVEWCDATALALNYPAGEWPTYTLGSKWDGISGSLLYEKGDLRRALTRGDGMAGENILSQVLSTKSIPKELPGPFSFEVRGELVIENTTMVLLNTDLALKGKKEYMSTRNLVAGTMKLKDYDEVTRRCVQFRPWEVLIEGDPTGFVDSAHDRLQDVSEWGFFPPDDVAIHNREELKRELVKFIAKLNDATEEIGRDGLVLKVDSFEHRKTLGVGSKTTNYQVAYKAQNAKTDSYVRDVIWQVGRQGKLTPVAVIDPVVLAGAKIERATLYNLTWINELKVRIGSHVTVCRSGDVIPQITEVLDD